ncbi:MAG: hypothetical protein IT365_04475 [Candidatus Hydrogenedentes bacterium]|nr:hypothetical protein [Candidatus Hydrogenedentota bacterium]
MTVQDRREDKLNRGLDARHLRMLRASELAGCIAENADRTALDEFHSRRLFEVAGRGLMTFGEFIEVWRIETSKSMGTRHRTGDIIDRATQLVMDRWSRLPVETEASVSPDHQEAEESASPPTRKLRETDCSKTFAAVTKLVHEDFAAKPPDTEAELESREAALLQGLVFHQLGYCLKEARREEDLLTSRYRWPVNGSHVTVRFPKDFPGKQRRLWLEAHIGQFDPSDSREAGRIQAAIDAWFPKPGFVALHENLAGDIPAPPWEVDLPLGFRGVRSSSVQEFVADEKAAGIEVLPTAIRGLGVEGVRNLVLDVLNNLVSGEFTDAALSSRHGLSRATFSRFAGREWLKSNSNRVQVPHLYVNIAKIVARVPWLLEAAKSVGLWERVSAIASGSRKHQGGTAHGS